MKLFIMTFALAVVTVESFNCYDAATKKTKECDSGVDKCHGPEWTDYTGYDNEVRGCGDCPSGQEKCKPCNTDDCNKPGDVTSYKCYEYTVTDKKQTNKKETDCAVMKEGGKKLMCLNYKSGQEDMKYAVGGCGVCPEADSKICDACEGNLCNGTLKMSFNLFILIAVIKALL